MSTIVLRAKLDRLDVLGFDTAPVRQTLNDAREAGLLTDRVIRHATVTADAAMRRLAAAPVRPVSTGVVGGAQLVADRHGALRPTPKRRGRTVKDGNTLAQIASYLPAGDPRRARYCHA